MERSHRRIGRGLTVTAVGCLTVVTAACCPTVAGPTAPLATLSAALAPGEFQFADVDTPPSTTQINLTFKLDSVTVPLRLRQIDPGCLPTVNDTCPNLADTTMGPRPAGVLQFGNGLQPHGARTRVVVQNMSPDTTITLTLTIQPHRAGCT